MRVFRLIGCLLGVFVLAQPDGAPADWPETPWSPELGLSVPVTRFSAKDAGVLPILCALDNECGVVFGYVDLDPSKAPLPPVTLSLENCTAGDVVAALSKAAEGFDWTTTDGVVVAVRFGADGRPPPLLAARIETFDAAEAPLHEFKGSLFGALAKLEGMPPAYALEHEVYGAGGVPRVTLHLANVTALDLLRKSAGLLNQSWVLALDASRTRASLSMGGRWGRRADERVAVEVAPGAPREPLRGEPPPPEIVQERVHAAILDARLRRVQREEAADELASLIGDPWARQHAWMDVLEAVRLLGDMRAETAVDALVRNIDIGSASSVKMLRERLKAARDGTGVYASAPNTPPETRQAIAREAWVRSFPAVEALGKIGLPAVPAILNALGATDPNAPPGPNEPVYAQEERERKVILFCETLERMLGKEAAARKLEEAAAAQQDAAAAGRLRDAAKRITEGAMLPGVP